MTHKTLQDSHEALLTGPPNMVALATLPQQRGRGIAFRVSPKQHGLVAVSKDMDVAIAEASHRTRPRTAEPVACVCRSGGGGGGGMCKCQKRPIDMAQEAY